MMFADEIFRPGVPESKKFELIYRRGGSLPPEDLENAIAHLRTDCRYARFLAALIDASKNEKLAIEELFSGNAVSPKIVTSCKWLYLTENKGFISEDFVRNTLPSVSSSCQKQIVGKISKWVSNVQLGDKLSTIVRARSVRLSSMLLGACSNDLIMKEIEKDSQRLSLAQMLDILKKRFDSGIELIRRIAAAGKFSSSALDKNELYHSILNGNFETGCELLRSIESPTVALGRHFTRKLVKHDSTSKVDIPLLLKSVNNVKQKRLAYYASPEAYSKCFLAKFPLKPSTILMLKWLNHLRDEAKLKRLEAWYQDRRGSALVDNPMEVPMEFLFLLDEKTLQDVVTQKIAIESRSENFTDKDLLLLQSVLPDDDESFAKQKERLEGESCQSVREEIYLSMLKSVTILKRPQYLERRLKFLALRTRNYCDSPTALVWHLQETISKEYKFTVTEEIWPHLKDMIELRVMLKNEDIECCFLAVLLVALNKVSFNQQTLLAAIMEVLNRLFMRRNSEYTPSFRVLSHEKRRYFWNAALAHCESLKATDDVLNGGPCPKHMRCFYASLIKQRKVTRDLIRAYPKILKVLKLFGNPQSANCQMFYFSPHKLYELLEPFLERDDPLCYSIENVKREKRKADILKAFRKSKIMTEEIPSLYVGERRPRGLVPLCERSLLHAEPEQLSQWTLMLKEDIAKNPGHTIARRGRVRLRERCYKRRRYVLAAYSSVRLLSMITTPQQIKAEVAASYPAEAKFDLSKGDSEKAEMLKRIRLVESLKFFNDSIAAAEMIMHFMKGDYLKHALGAFSHHLSRLPTAKVAGYLREPILKKDSALSARKVMLQGFFMNTLMIDEKVIFDIVRQLSTREEHDNIKNETLIAIYNIVDSVGEERGWPLVKACLDSIRIKDRTCFTTTLLSKTSIDKNIPINLEYLMMKLLEIGETENYEMEYYGAVLERIGSNVEMLSHEFLFSILDRIKSKDWLRSTETACLARNILNHCVPEHAEALKGHFRTFGNSKCLDFGNCMALTNVILDGCVSSALDRVSAPKVVSFLRAVLEERSPKNFLELRKLDLIEGILPLFPEERYDDGLLPWSREITLTALRLTAGFLEKFGVELIEMFVEILLGALLDVLFPRLRDDSEWSRWFLEVYDDEFSALETMIFLRILAECKLDEHCAEKCKELFLEQQDRNVRMAFGDVLYYNSALFVAH